MINFDNLAFRNINKVDFTLIESEYKKQKIDFDSYKKQKIGHLNKFVSNKIKIYLDLKYLIKIRDSLSLKNTSLNKKIFFRLKELVENEKVICPFSDCIFEELLKQPSNNRIKTAEILDILSNNISLKPLHFIFIQEFINAINFYNEKELDEINYWDYPISIKGNLDFEIANNKDIDIDLWKIFSYEGMIGTTIQELISYHEEIKCSSISLVAEKLFGRIQYKTEEKSINKIIRQEIESCFISIAEELKIPTGLVSEKLQDFKVEDIERVAPCLFVFCSLHAEMIKDSEKKYKKNDFYDIMHCSLAIPNCDYFFTEDSFMHRTKNVLKLNQKYNVKIESKPEKILSLINEI